MDETGSGRLSAVELTAVAAHLLATYAWAIDGGEAHLMAEVFTDDVDADYEGFACQGRAALVERLDALHGDLRATQHLVGSVLARPRGEGAGVRSHVRATLVAGRGRRLEVAARYDDDLVCTSAGWRIRARQVKGLWMSGDRTILPWMSDDMCADQRTGRG